MHVAAVKKSPNWITKKSPKPAKKSARAVAQRHHDLLEKRKLEHKVMDGALGGLFLETAKAHKQAKIDHTKSVARKRRFAEEMEEIDLSALQEGLSNADTTETVVEKDRPNVGSRAYRNAL